jgi:hypothetical protein
MAGFDVTSRDSFERSLREAVQLGMKEIVEDEVQKAQIRLAERLREYAATTAIRLASWAEVESRKDRLIITVQLPEEQK